MAHRKKHGGKHGGKHKKLTVLGPHMGAKHVAKHGRRKHGGRRKRA